MPTISLSYRAMLASYVMTVLVIELTPGPNMAYLAALTLGSGRRAGLAAVAGIATGLALMGVAAAAGLAALVAANPALWDALRWAGGVYLLYLAWETWKGETGHQGTGPEETGPEENGPEENGHHGTASQPGTARPGWLAHFRRGLITNILNPKAALFYVAIVPRFTPPDSPALAYGLVLTAISIAVATLVHLIIVLLAAQAHPLLRQPGRIDRTRHGLAIALAAIALWFFVTTAGPVSAKPMPNAPMPTQAGGWNLYAAGP